MTVRSTRILVFLGLSLLLIGCGSARLVLPQEILDPLSTLVVDLNIPGVTVEAPIEAITALPAVIVTGTVIETQSAEVASETPLAIALTGIGNPSTTPSEVPSTPVLTALPMASATPTPMPLPTRTAAPSATVVKVSATSQPPASTATNTIPTNTASAGGGCVTTGNGSFESQVIALINQERAAEGLPALKANNKLTNAARAHSQDMACIGFFSHNSPSSGDPFDRIVRAGYSFSSAGENIAAGYGSAAETVQGWMESPGHRANILGANFTEIGIGYAYWAESSYRSYITAVFAAP